MKKQLLLSAAFLSASLLSVQAQIYFQDDFNRDDTASGLGTDWSLGDTTRPSITSNQVTYSGGLNPDVFGVDLTGEGIGQNFKVAVDIEFTAPAFSGVWFLAGSTVGDLSGYVVRLRPGDGLVQFLDFDGGTGALSLANWSGEESTSNSGVGQDTPYRMTVTSLTGGVFNTTIENLNTSTIVASRTATRTNAFDSVGSYFGIYATNSAVINDNFLVAIPEPGAFALIFASLAGALVLVRRRR